MTNIVKVYHAGEEYGVGNNILTHRMKGYRSYGNCYTNSPTTSTYANTRKTLHTAIHLKAGVVITAKTGYQFGIYRNTEGEETGEYFNMGNGWITSYTTPSENDYYFCFMYVPGGTETKINIDATIEDMLDMEDYSPFYEDVLETPSPWKGKTVAFIGDSITAGSGTTIGQRYCDYLADWMGVRRTYVDGIGGSCYSKTSDYGTSPTPLSMRYTHTPISDLIVVFMGTNDYGHGTPIGYFEDFDGVNDISFYSACRKSLGELQSIYGGKVVVMTPLHRKQLIVDGQVTHPTDDTPNAQGNTLQDYVDALKDVCRQYSIPVIDLYAMSSFTPRSLNLYNEYTTDGLHPNEGGHYMIAREVLPILNNFAFGPNDNQKTIQRKVLPTASAIQLGKIIQYTGTTDANYTNGFFYKCVAGETAGTYERQNIDVQQTTLVDLEDTNITTPTNGDVMRYNSTTEKWENQHLNNVITFKGSVATVDELPDSDQENGDVWHVSDTGVNYIRNGTSWDIYTEPQLDEIEIQKTVMPEASEDELGNIYQYVGEDTTEFNNSRWYKCVAGTTSGTYVWEEADMKNMVAKGLDGLPLKLNWRTVAGFTGGRFTQTGDTIKIKWDSTTVPTNAIGVASTPIPDANTLMIIEAKVNGGNVDYCFRLGFDQYERPSDWSKFSGLESFSALSTHGRMIVDMARVRGNTENMKSISINTRGRYTGSASTWTGTSADVELKLTFISKDVIKNCKNFAKISETAMIADKAKYTAMQPVPFIKTTTFKTQTGPNASANVNGWGMNISDFVGAAQRQCYGCVSYNLSEYIGKGYKFIFTCKQTYIRDNSTRFTLNQIHNSTAYNARNNSNYTGSGIIPNLNNWQVTLNIDDVVDAEHPYLVFASYLEEHSGTQYYGNVMRGNAYIVDGDWVAPIDMHKYYTKEETNALLGNNNYITCWGDSLTAGGGWTATLASLSGMTVKNGGTGGEDARTIVARQGADVMMVNNVTIPASGAVTLYTRSGDVGIPTQEGYKVTPLLQGGAHVNPVKIGDIEGTLAWTGSSYADQNGTWKFTRSAAGEETVIDRPTAMTTNFDRNWNAPHLLVIFIGQNGGYSDLDDLVRQHRMMIEHSNAKHYVVLGLTSQSAAYRGSYDARMKKEFGRYFINLREYLSTPIYDENDQIISCYGMADQNVEIDPEYTYNGKTTVQEISEGIVPHQILADSVHYTAGTKTVIGNYIYKRCCELGIF